jgi:PAS domain-containing protein
LKQVHLAELTLDLFAARTAVEMERRRSGDALQASQQHNRAILEAIPDLVLLLDGAGTVLNFSANSGNEFYAQREDVTGKNVREVLPFSVAVEIKHAFERALGSGARPLWISQLEPPTDLPSMKLVPCLCTLKES